MSTWRRIFVGPQAAALIVVFSAIAGCGGDAKTGAPEMCATPTGLYRMTTVVESGNCPSTSSEAIISFDTVSQPVGGRIDPGCQGASTPSADRCSYTYEQTCELGFATITIRGKATWNADATMGSDIRGVMTVSTVTGTCSGVWQNTYQKL